MPRPYHQTLGQRPWPRVKRKSWTRKFLQPLSFGKCPPSIAPVCPIMGRSLGAIGGGGLVHSSERDGYWTPQLYHFALQKWYFSTKPKSSPMLPWHFSPTGRPGEQYMGGGRIYGGKLDWYKTHLKKHMNNFASIGIFLKARNVLRASPPPGAVNWLSPRRNSFIFMSGITIPSPCEIIVNNFSKATLFPSQHKPEPYYGNSKSWSLGVKFWNHTNLM